MAATGRRADPPLARRLFEHGYEFGFFEAVRLLARLHPEREPVGGDALPATEAVRFHARNSLAFPASAIHEIQRDDRGQPHMTVAFLGLTGRQGVLPFHYTEYLLDRLRKKDTTAAAFFDLFQHRLVSLFYRAWAKYHLPALYEADQRNAAISERGPSQYFYDLIGLGTQGLRGRMAAFDDRGLLFYAGLIAQRPHSASAVESILRDYFQVPVRIQQFRGKWFPLSDQELSYLRLEGRHNELGGGAIAGDAVWLLEARIRIVVGPLTYSRFCAFLPGGAALPKLFELTQLIVDRRVGFDVQLTLLASEVRALRLADEGVDPPRLGLSCWLKTSEFATDASDVVLTARAGGK